MDVNAHDELVKNRYIQVMAAWCSGHGYQVIPPDLLHHLTS